MNRLSLAGGQVAATLAAVLALAVPGRASTSLHDDAHITTSITAAAVADRIRKGCPTISGRMVRAFFKAQALYSYALREGHSRAEITAFLKDKNEKARLKRLTAAYLRSHGVQREDAASLCALGDREIAADSLTGSLLRRD